MATEGRPLHTAPLGWEKQHVPLQLDLDPERLALPHFQETTFRKQAVVELRAVQ